MSMVFVELLEFDFLLKTDERAMSFLLQRNRDTTSKNHFSNFLTFFS